MASLWRGGSGPLGPDGFRMGGAEREPAGWLVGETAAVASRPLVEHGGRTNAARKPRAGSSGEPRRRAGSSGEPRAGPAAAASAPFLRVIAAGLAEERPRWARGLSAGGSSASSRRRSSRRNPSQRSSLAVTRAGAVGLVGALADELERGELEQGRPRRREGMGPTCADPTRFKDTR